MDIKPIRTEDEYNEALAAIDGLMEAAPGSPKGDGLDVRVTLVEAYEALHWAIEAPDPIEAIAHVMEARGLKSADLASVIGSQPHASEVLRRKRPLSLAMIRAISSQWELSADILVQEYELNPAA